LYFLLAPLAGETRGSNLNQFTVTQSVFAIDSTWQQRARNRRTSPSERDSELASHFPSAYGTPESLKDLSDAIDLINAKAKEKYYGGGPVGFQG
jgi:hypothetical protein